MKYEDFEKVINSLKLISKRTSILYEQGVDVIEYEDIFHSTINTLLSNIFDEKSMDWIDWFCCDADFGEKDLKATDKDGKEICRNIKELYELLNTK
jgi:hypothetical protein